MGAQFDHIEVHVEDIDRYCAFLARLFEGGAHEVISPTGTSMFTSPDGIRIEVKRRKADGASIPSGFCNPCLRRPAAGAFIAELGVTLDHVRETASGPVYFFRDHEGILWHIKDLPTS